jgi:hypothetical protein
LPKLLLPYLFSASVAVFDKFNFPRPPELVEPRRKKTLKTQKRD